MEKEPASFESVWATLQEFGARLEQSSTEADRSNAESTKKLEAVGEYLNQVGKRIDEMGKNVNQVSQQLGGMGNSNGAVAEEFFFNSLKYKRRNLFGQKFDRIIREEIRKSNEGYEDEYDIMMFNGESVCVVEVKYKADTDDIKHVLRKKHTFRVNYPEYNDKKLYLALASMTFHKRTEKACQDNGIAIIKQVGKTVAIYDEHLKAF